MDAHRRASLQDAATKQYDSAVESAKQFGRPELPEVFTAEEKKRCRLDGGEDEDGTLRLPNVDVVPAPEPAHVLREKTQAVVEKPTHEASLSRHAIDGRACRQVPQVPLGEVSQ